MHPECALGLTAGASAKPSLLDTADVAASALEAAGLQFSDADVAALVRLVEAADGLLKGRGEAESTPDSLHAEFLVQAAQWLEAVSRSRPTLCAQLRREPARTAQLFEAIWSACVCLSRKEALEVFR